MYKDQLLSAALTLDLLNIKPPFSFHLHFGNLIDKVTKYAGQGPAYAKLSDKRPLRILLADDDSDDRQLFVEVLADISTNFEIQLVEDGLQLMSLLYQADDLPNVLFLDLNMPGKNGKECLAEIRGNVKLKNLPVVIYTTSAHTKDIQDTHNMGANLYLRKPNTFSGHKSVIKQVIEFDLEKLLLVQPIHHFVLSPE